MYYDPLLMVTILLLLVTLVAAVLYYGRIRRAREEYEKARDVVGDVVISFNRQMQRQEDRLGVISYKTEALSSRSAKLMGKVENHDGQLAELSAKVEGFSGIDQKVSTRINGIDKKVDAVAAHQEKMMQKIAEIEKREYKVPAIPETKVEAAVPIKREKVLAPLTETELNVLEILATEGGKTAPEIKDRIKLTREHTARLMKKLYEEGYLERDTQKIPFSYRVKEEMRRILKKAEAKT